MLVDSWYDAYLGVIVLVRIIDGVLKKGERIKMLSNDSVHHVDRIGVFKPQREEIAELGPGEMGFLTASIKQVRDTRVGDTITHEKKGTDEALPGFKPAQPVVFCGLFPVDSAEFEDLRDAIDKLALNSRWKHLRLWVLAFAVVSWDCCIWKSFATGSSASITLS